MTSINLDILSLSELKSLQKDIAKAIADFSGRKKTEAIAALEAHAKELGFSLAELTNGKKTRTGMARGKKTHAASAAPTYSAVHGARSAR